MRQRTAAAAVEAEKVAVAVAAAAAADIAAVVEVFMHIMGTFIKR